MQHTKLGWIVIGVLAVFTAGVAADLPRRILAAEADPAVEAWPADAEARLRDRFEEYERARVEEDWTALYELAAPAERQRVDLPGFLRFYGHGVLATHGLELTSVELDPASRSAATQVDTDAELVPARFPKHLRATFRMPEDPADLRGIVTSDLDWVYSQGAWYFRMEKEIVTGLADSGERVLPTVR